MEESPLHKDRRKYKPAIPAVLNNLTTLKAIPQNTDNSKKSFLLKERFSHTLNLPSISFAPQNNTPHSTLRVGVVLSGGQAPGGHNVIAGLYDALKALDQESILFGFVGGPSGIVNKEYVEITKELLDPYRNQGGFDLIGSGRTKIETLEQFAATEQTVNTLKLDGLVVVGGDDSNTNAALLAEYFCTKKHPLRVVGVPKTIDGDLKNDKIETSFGFDTACKVYSEMIGNILRDALSARKYYFFIKLMGRSASHITLECALQTHPNLTLIGEEIEAKERSLQEVIKQICDLVEQRAAQGKEFGTILIPEGVVEFIPEFKRMIAELNSVLAIDSDHQENLEAISNKGDKIEYASNQLSDCSHDCFETLPADIKMQLLLDRDPHGNVQVSKIDTERLFITMVEEELKRRDFKGNFSAQPAFFGYEGRSSYPSNFDCSYCSALGQVAALLIDQGCTGYMACVNKLTQPTADWGIEGVPITSMLVMEKRHGKDKPVIEKALVKLDEAPFLEFATKRKEWELEDKYRNPGPIQFHGPVELTGATTITLQLESNKAAPATV